MSTMSYEEPELVEARHLVERAQKLPSSLREDIAAQLLATLDSADDTNGAELLSAWHAELQRRVDGIKDGSMATYSIEETMAYVRQALAKAR